MRPLFFKSFISKSHCEQGHTSSQCETSCILQQYCREEESQVILVQFVMCRHCITLLYSMQVLLNGVGWMNQRRGDLQVRLWARTEQRFRLSTDLQSHREGVSLGATVSHVGLNELKDVHCLLLHGAVWGHDHWLLDGLTAPGQHVGNGHFSPKQTLRKKARDGEKQKRRATERARGVAEKQGTTLRE